MRRGIAVAIALLVAAAACGGGSESPPTQPPATPSEPETTTEAPADEPVAPTTTAAVTTTTATAGFDPATATEEEKKARYLELAAAYGVEERLLIDDEVFDEEGELIVENQIVGIALIQCQNPREDWESFFEGMSIIEDDLDPVAANRAALLDAFCPEARPLFEEVAASLGVTVPPPAEP
ncbi:MAG: hypothetical protein ACE5MI_05450 [Acidimicrobiia bacterium]